VINYTTAHITVVSNLLHLSYGDVDRCLMYTECRRSVADLEIWNIEARRPKGFWGEALSLFAQNKRVKHSKNAERDNLVASCHITNTGVQIHKN